MAGYSALSFLDNHSFNYDDDDDDDDVVVVVFVLQQPFLDAENDVTSKTSSDRSVLDDNSLTTAPDDRKRYCLLYP